MTPTHEHDCESCEYVGSYPLRHPRELEYEGGWTDTGDLYVSCANSHYRWIVRYGPDGEYATTDDPGIYIKFPVIVARDRYGW